MKTRRYSTLYVLATGFLVLFVTVLVLFWARWGCESARYSLLPEQARTVVVDASRLIARKTGRDPNGIPLRFVAQIRPEEVSAQGLGIQQYQRAHELGSPESSVYVWSKGDKDPPFYFDRSRGLMVLDSVIPVIQSTGSAVPKSVLLYAGPEGISEKPDKQLGRFRDPVMRLIAGDLDRPIVYDRSLRRFFAIHWPSKTVHQGSPLPARAPAPVDFGWPRKQPGCLYISLDTQVPHYTYGTNPDRIVVLDEAGRIQMLDLTTLAFTGSVGRLPDVAALFASGRRPPPDDLFAFEVHPVFFGRGEIYAGYAVAALSRDGTAMRLDVFDANGLAVGGQDGTVTGIPRGDGRERHTTLLMVTALYERLPGAAALSITKFILESLHPPVLLWLSYFTGPGIEATAGHRSLFILPNSFAAMKNTDLASSVIPCFVSALPFLVPGLFVGIALARLVGADARRAGVPARTRRLWMAATVLFALPAYVTYQITRPKTARVTCQNCGRDRWVDGEKCHHCGSPWLVPELVPPAWRVIGRPEEQTCDNPSPRPEETISRKFEV